MNSHKNARLTIKGRERLMQLIEADGLKPAAHATGISSRSAAKWKARFRCNGAAGLQDRSSRPHRTRTVVSDELRERIVGLRREKRRMRGIAQETGVSLSTVSRLLAAAGLSSLKALEPPKPVIRYEHENPGDLLHLDIKKLGRIEKVGHRITGNPRDNTNGAGWEFVHVAIDDHSRVSFAKDYPNEQKESVVAFLQAAVAYYASLGITIRRILTDNGPAYRSKFFQRACQAMGIKHRFTRPYRPQTNGKAERFIQTALREWAYARSYSHSRERTAALQPWIEHYNTQRPHTALGHQPPYSRLPMNNVLQLNT